MGTLSSDRESSNQLMMYGYPIPPSNPELLDELSAKFTEYNYDFKKLVRDVCNSRIYQLSTKTNISNESDTRNFARSHLRRLRAEVMLDVISQATSTKNKFQGLPSVPKQFKSQTEELVTISSPPSAGPKRNRMLM